MIHIPLPKDIEPQFNWLRELYPWQLLMGELIHLSDAMFAKVEWTKPLQDQDVELASYQFYASIQKLYEIEYANTITAGVV